MSPPSEPIIIALGANLPHRRRSPQQSLKDVLAAMPGYGLHVIARSLWYRSRPVPASDQPDFINGVILVETELEPELLLARLHEIERAFGRTRRRRNEARAIDLDLIAYGGRVIPPSSGGLVLPHPRAHQRAFVLLPLRDVAPDWCHPVTGQTLAALIDLLPHPHGVEPL